MSDVPAKGVGEDSVTSIGGSAFECCFSLADIYFEGNAPRFEDDFVFCDVTATAYYPEGDSTWTTDVMQDYDGTITWQTWNPGST